MRIHENAKAVCLEDTSNRNMVRMHYVSSEFSPPPIGEGQVLCEQRTNCIMQEYRITQEKTCDDKDEQKESIFFSGGLSSKIGMQPVKGKTVIGSDKSILEAESISMRIHENAQDISNGNMAVASMDFPEVTKYRALVSAQAHREEIIQDLYSTCQDPVKGIVQAGMIRNHLMAFYQNTLMKPHRIIFYRDGVSEGQFSKFFFMKLMQLGRLVFPLYQTISQELLLWWFRRDIIPSKFLDSACSMEVIKFFLQNAKSLEKIKIIQKKEVDAQKFYALQAVPLASEAASVSFVSLSASGENELLRSVCKKCRVGLWKWMQENKRKPSGRMRYEAAKSGSSLGNRGRTYMWHMILEVTVITNGLVGWAILEVTLMTP